MEEANEISTQLSSKEYLTIDDGSPPTAATQYRHVLGSLQYLSLTYPDVFFFLQLINFPNSCIVLQQCTGPQLSEFCKNLNHV